MNRLVCLRRFCSSSNNLSGLSITQLLNEKPLGNSGGEGRGEGETERERERQKEKASQTDRGEREGGGREGGILKVNLAYIE